MFLLDIYYKFIVLIIGGLIHSELIKQYLKSRLNDVRILNGITTIAVKIILKINQSDNVRLCRSSLLMIGLFFYQRTEFCFRDLTFLLFQFWTAHFKIHPLLRTTIIIVGHLYSIVDCLEDRYITFKLSNSLTSVYYFIFCVFLLLSQLLNHFFLSPQL